MKNIVYHFFNLIITDKKVLFVIILRIIFLKYKFSCKKNFLDVNNKISNTYVNISLLTISLLKISIILKTCLLLNSLIIALILKIIIQLSNKSNILVNFIRQ